MDKGNKALILYVHCEINKIPDHFKIIINSIEYYILYKLSIGVSSKHCIC